MSNKYVRVEYKDHVWEVDLKHIADNRAKYYADSDPDTTYQEEFDYAMEDDYEWSDWFFNNMDWEDVAEHAVLIDTPKPLSNPVINDEYCNVELITRKPSLVDEHINDTTDRSGDNVCAGTIEQ